jgi:hypothetical protein
MMHIRPHRIPSSARVASCLLLAVAGCASAPPESVVLKEHTDLKISTSQLRYQVRALAKPFSGIIEGAADQILGHATTPEERITALRFKINGVPAFQGALFEPDPVAAAFDTTALIEQTRIYVEEGPGRALPPLVKANVLNALASMRDRMLKLGDSIGATPAGQEHFWATAEEWAREHPMTDGFTSRETTQALFAEYLGDESGGLMAMARRAEETVADLASRFDVYGEYIAKQIRWQGELMLEESLALGIPQRAVDAVEPIQVGVAGLPFDVEIQRDLILAAVQAERGLILDWIRAERVDTLEFVQLERKAVEGLVGRERELVLEAVRAEREAVLAEVSRQRIAAMDDLGRVAADAIEEAQEKVIDHLMWRVVQLLAVVLPLTFLGAWFLIWYAKRS